MRIQPEVIIFDVDGVLVDVRGSYHTTVLETVRFFTGKRVTRAELHAWKSRSGFNDDWKLSTTWVHTLGGKAKYAEVKEKFVELYWGNDGKDKKGSKGNVSREKWLLPKTTLRRLAKRSELALFTGRVGKEIDYTIDLCGVRQFFRKIVTVEDVERPKPDPEGLLKILQGRDPSASIYIGDNVDDARAARSAGMPFVGILPASKEGQRERRALLKKLGAIAVLRDINQFEAWLNRPSIP